jgi:hypothetical protein
VDKKNATLDVCRYVRYMMHCCVEERLLGQNDHIRRDDTRISFGPPLSFSLALYGSRQRVGIQIISEYGLTRDSGLTSLK